MTETRRRCSIGALLAQGPALVGLLLSLALTTGCKPSDKQGRTSESLEAEGTSGTGLSAIRFQTSGLYTSVDLDEHWMLLLLEAVDRDGPAGDVVSRTLGGTASRPSNWMGTVWTIDGWVAASLTSTPVPGVGGGAAQVQEVDATRAARAIPFLLSMLSQGSISKPCGSSNWSDCPRRTNLPVTQIVRSSRYASQAMR